MNQESCRVWVVIPAFNEAQSIARVLADLAAAGWRNQLVVDDGSEDETAAIARQQGARVLQLLINRGQGAALRTGIEYLARAESPDVIVTFDADGQHLAQDVARLVEPILKGRADVALGSRFLHSRSQVPFFRALILKAGVFFTWIVSDIPVTDTHNGLRAFGRKAYASIRIRQRGMEHASEILDEIKKRRLTFREAPVQVLYSAYSRRKGQPLANFLNIGVRFILKKLIA